MESKPANGVPECPVLQFLTQVPVLTSFMTVNHSQPLLLLFLMLIPAVSSRQARTGLADSLTAAGMVRVSLHSGLLSM